MCPNSKPAQIVDKVVFKFGLGQFLTFDKKALNSFNFPICKSCLVELHNLKMVPFFDKKNFQFNFPWQIVKLMFQKITDNHLLSKFVVKPGDANEPPEKD
ncbi:hypothetical protein T05_2092 [Trichinella murrelli]|uniref:Uncharacterized protein n=1 Tax=Trichinella murrelli TaxID=144512 RepID=A0A0V0TSZ8_9BILA|nr:hypothetical protein T05_2092 [Trichinella murrelli]